LNSTKSGQVEQGNVGGGTGMSCHQFKGGIGTSSRVLQEKHGGFVVGVLVQANYGIRAHLTIAGVPVGKEITNPPYLSIEKCSINGEIRCFEIPYEYLNENFPKTVRGSSPRCYDS